MSTTQTPLSLSSWIYRVLTGVFGKAGISFIGLLIFYGGGIFLGLRFVPLRSL